MTKQEEIREGIAILISGCYSKELSVCSKHTIFRPQKFLNELFPYLHSQGVVIKVDDKKIKEDIGYIPVGYVAVAPLIGGE